MKLEWKRVDLSLQIRIRKTDLESIGYFTDRGPDEFFDSLGKTPEYYNVGFETLLQNPYWMNCSRLQDLGSDKCGLY